MVIDEVFLTPGVCLLSDRCCRRGPRQASRRDLRWWVMQLIHCFFTTCSKHSKIATNSVAKLHLLHVTPQTRWVLCEHDCCVPSLFWVWRVSVCRGLERPACHRGLVRSPHRPGPGVGRSHRWLVLEWWCHMAQIKTEGFCTNLHWLFVVIITCLFNRASRDFAIWLKQIIFGYWGWNQHFRIQYAKRERTKGTLNSCYFYKLRFNN